MPLLVAALLGGLVQAAGSLVGRVLLALGVGYVSYSGIDTLISAAKSGVVVQFGLLPPDVVALASTMKVGVAISIIFSAISIRLVLQGLTSGAIKKMVQR